MRRQGRDGWRNIGLAAALALAGLGVAIALAQPVGTTTPSAPAAAAPQAGEQVLGPIVGPTLGLTPNYSGTHIIWTGTVGAQYAVVVDGVSGPPFGDVRARFTPDGRHVIAWARNGQREQMHIDGAAGPEYDGVSGPAFSFDDAHVAYLARNDKRWRAEPWSSWRSGSSSLFGCYWSRGSNEFRMPNAECRSGRRREAPLFAR